MLVKLAGYGHKAASGVEERGFSREPPTAGDSSGVLSGLCRQFCVKKRLTNTSKKICTPNQYFLKNKNKSSG